MGAEPHLVIVHGKMHGAAAELEQQLLRIAIALVLLHGIEHRLLGELVLEFEGGDGQAVDEHGQVESKRGLVAAVSQLTRDAEEIGGESLGRLHVARRRHGVEKVQMGRAGPDAGAQTVHHAALGDLALEPVQELGALGAILVDAESFISIGLGGGKKLDQLGQIDGMFPVVILRIALDVSGLLHQEGDDEALKPFFVSVFISTSQAAMVCFNRFVQPVVAHFPAPAVREF